MHSVFSFYICIQGLKKYASMFAKYENTLQDIHIQLIEIKLQCTRNGGESGQPENTCAHLAGKIWDFGTTKT